MFYSSAGGHAGEGDSDNDDVRFTMAFLVLVNPYSNSRFSPIVLDENEEYLNDERN